MQNVEYSEEALVGLSLKQIGSLLKQGKIQPYQFGAAVMRKHLERRGGRKSR